MMKCYIKELITVICFAACSCKTEPPTCSITVNELTKKHGDIIFKIEPENSNTDFRDKGEDSIVGGYYSFYKNGKLKQYDFFADQQTVIYQEQFDTTGYLMYQKGSPLIHKSADLISDSLVIKFHLSSLTWNYTSVNISASSEKSYPVTLLNDSLFSNVRVAQFVINKLSEEQDIVAYINVQGRNLCTGTIKTITDSVNLHYTPKKDISANKQ